MRNHLRLPVIAIAITLVASCSSAATPAPATAPPATAAPATAAPATAAPATAAPATAAPATAAPATAAPATEPPATEAPSQAAESPGGSPAAWEGVDDGTKLTLWSRAATQARAEALVEAYNASHKNQIELTVVPTDDYQTKVGAAAGRRRAARPVLGRRRVHAQLDLGGAVHRHHGQDRHAAVRRQASPRARSTCRPGRARSTACRSSSTCRSGCTTRSCSRQAGLDPDKPPTTLAEFAADARAVQKLGGDVHGTFFGGNCGGCDVFTWWPIAWADGETVMNPEGTESLLNSDENKAIYATFRELVEDGTALMPDTKTETGPDLDRLLPEGQDRHHADAGQPDRAWPTTASPTRISASPRSPASRAASRRSSAATPSGSRRDSKKADAAWNFLAWLAATMRRSSRSPRAATSCLAPDLANNKYSAADPRLVIFNTIAAKGQTPFAQALRADVQRSAGAVARRCSATRSSATRARSTPTTRRSTSRSSNPVAHAGVVRDRPVRSRTAPSVLAAVLQQTSRDAPRPNRRLRAARARASAGGAPASCWASPTRLPTLVFVASSSSCRCSSSLRMSASDWPLLAGDRGINFPDELHRRSPSNRLFWPAVVFTIEYTVLVTVLLIGLGLGLALLVQEGGRWVGMLRTVFLLPGRRSAWRRRRFCSGASTRRSIGPLSPIRSSRLGLHRRVRSRSSARR